MGVIRNQREAVLNHLKKKGSITSMEAIEGYGATRLSSIIHDLRHNYGYEIETRTEVTKNRFGNTTEYARYIWKEDMYE